MASITQKTVRDACERSQAMTGHEIGYIIVALHPGDSMWAPDNTRQGWRTIRNDSDDVEAYRMAMGCGMWVTPVPAGRIHADDPPILCTCGFMAHTPPETA
jgi:hypothetical protein